MHFQRLCSSISLMMIGGGGGGGFFPEICVGVYGVLLETLTLFQTKICDFPYPISDLTQNSIPYFIPDPYPIPFAWAFENFLKFPTIIKSHSSDEENEDQGAHTLPFFRTNCSKSIPYFTPKRFKNHIYP